jgi:hypothetical protein
MVTGAAEAEIVQPPRAGDDPPSASLGAGAGPAQAAGVASAPSATAATAAPPRRRPDPYALNL